MNTLSTQQVQHTLNQIGYDKEFVVIFLKADGSQRKMRCMMQAPTGPKRQLDAVPVIDLDIEAWRSFKLDSVLNIE